MIMSKRPRSDFGETRMDAPFRLKRRLWASVELGDYDAVQKALDDGAPIDSKDADGRTSLVYMLLRRKRNWPKIAGLLINRGADVRGKYGKGTNKKAAQDILIQINDEEALATVELYALGIFTS